MRIRRRYWLSVLVAIVFVSTTTLAIQLHTTRYEGQARAADPSYVVYDTDPLLGSRADRRPTKPGPRSTPEGFWAWKATINDESFQSLPDLAELRWADFSDSTISDSELTHLARMTQLEELSLRGTSITNEGLAHLAKSSNLRELDIANTRIGDAGLMHLRGLYRLESLTIGGTLVTPEGIERFRANCPRCNIDNDWREPPGVGCAKVPAIPIPTTRR